LELTYFRGTIKAAYKIRCNLILTGKHDVAEVTKLQYIFWPLELIIINYNIYGLICNKYILYNGLSNYIHNEVIKFYIGFIICHEN
jgi:hypothetical protein